MSVNAIYFPAQPSLENLINETQRGFSKMYSLVAQMCLKIGGNGDFKGSLDDNLEAEPEGKVTNAESTDGVDIEFSEADLAAAFADITDLNPDFAAELIISEVAIEFLEEGE